MNYQNHSDYSVASDGCWQLIYTNLLFGNMSQSVGDTSHYKQNRRRLMSMLPAGVSRNISFICPHKDKIIDTTREQGTTDELGLEIFECDGFIADVKVANLWMFPANCAPVVLYTYASSVVGYGHLSRQTTSLQLAYKLAKKYIAKVQVKPEMVQAYIGPSVHKENYVFPPHLANEFFDEKWQDHLSKTAEGVAVDVNSFVQSQLLRAGLLAKNIAADPIDTAALKHFSQNQGMQNKKYEGRNGAVLTHHEFRP